MLFFFLSLVRPHCVACFGLGPFLCFLVPGSSLLVPLLLSFSPFVVSCPFLGCFLMFLVPSLLRAGPFSSRSCRSFVPPLRLFHPISPFAFVPFVVGGGLPDVFLLCLFLCFEFLYRVLSLFVSALALSLRVLVLLSALFLGPLSFLSLWVIKFPYPGSPFRSCCGYPFLYSRS